MQLKTTLYIDIDDTIIAQVLPGSGFDLRPCVMTPLTVLGRMFDCCWLTSWPYVDLAMPCSGASISTLIRSLYGTRINETFPTPIGIESTLTAERASSSIAKSPEKWYWLEDPILKCEEAALAGGRPDGPAVQLSDE